jgi:hypothetical protein
MHPDGLFAARHRHIFLLAVSMISFCCDAHDSTA